MVVCLSRRFFNYEKFVYFWHPKSLRSKNTFNAVIRRLNHDRKGSVNTKLSNNGVIVFSTGDYARLADSCVVARMENTSVMAVVVSKPTTPTNGIPLVVNYRHKAAAAGRIPTNFLRREIGQSQREILCSRVVDRSIRPFFPENSCDETQITCSLMATDGIHDPEILAINAASAALSLANITWNGPVAAVKVGLIGEEYIINPTKQELQQSSLNIIVTGASGNMLVMVEGTANQLSTNAVLKGIRKGVTECQAIINHIRIMKQTFGTKPSTSTKETRETVEIDPRVNELVNSVSTTKLEAILNNKTLDKQQRDNQISAVRTELHAALTENSLNNFTSQADEMFYKVLKNLVRQQIFINSVRCDGRGLTDIRPIRCDVDVFKPLHGSALFQRGQTQVLCTATLDSKESALKLDPITMLNSDTKVKNFFLHYDFPSYATNEIGRIGGVGRREVGHGALAENGLKAIVPKDYPFTVRLNCEVLESNGSSSMASVCAGSLALMDAGVPIHTPCAGIAMGLMAKYNNSNEISDYKILTDILGFEDYFGDMDFKIAGTKDGITAMQLDLKIPGISFKVVHEILQRGVKATKDVLQVMNSVMPEPRTIPKPSMPVVESLEVPVHQRGKFVGVGGYNLNKIFVETGVQVNSESETNFTLFAPNKDAMEEAKVMIEELLKKDMEVVLEFGHIYAAKIVEIRDTGVMVTLYPGMKPTLLHTSQLDQRKVHHPEALGLTIGQELQVKYFGRDPVTGTMRLSRKVLQDTTETYKSLHNG